jgi:hypothetical protein
MILSILLLNTKLLYETLKCIKRRFRSIIIPHNTKLMEQIIN